MRRERLKNVRNARRKRWKLNSKPKLAGRRKFAREKKRRRNSKMSNVESSLSNKLMQPRQEPLEKNKTRLRKFSMRRSVSRRSTKE